MSEASEGTRLNKYLSEIGHCSRRAADKLIDQGRIQVNGKAVVMGQKVSPQDRIEVDGILVENHLKSMEFWLKTTRKDQFISPLTNQRVSFVQQILE